VIKLALRIEPADDTKLAESVKISVNPWLNIIEFSETSESSVAKIGLVQSWVTVGVYLSNGD